MKIIPFPLFIFHRKTKRATLKRDTRNVLEDQVIQFTERMKVQTQQANNSEADIALKRKMEKAAARAVKTLNKPPRSRASKSSASKPPKNTELRMQVSDGQLPAPKKQRPKRSSTAVNYIESVDDFERLFS